MTGFQRTLSLDFSVKYSLCKKAAITAKQRSNPTTEVNTMLFLYLETGGKAASPAAVKAPKTQKMDNDNNIEVNTSHLRTACTSVLMNWPGAGNTVPAPATTVATAEKKDRLLNAQKTRTLSCSTAAKFSLFGGAAKRVGSRYV